MCSLLWIGFVVGLSVLHGLWCGLLCKPLSSVGFVLGFALDFVVGFAVGFALALLQSPLRPVSLGESIACAHPQLCRSLIPVVSV